MHIKPITKCKRADQNESTDIWSGAVLCVHQRHQLLVFFILIVFDCVCVCMFMWGVCARECGYLWKPEVGIGPLELELQAGLSNLAWVLVTEFGPFERAANTPSC